MKTSEKKTVLCPHCSESTIPRQTIDLDAWPERKSHWVCMFCGGELELAQEPVPEPEGKKNEPKKNALADLLGVTEEECDRPNLFAGTEKGHFCRNCRNFVLHPFVSRCALTDLPADPMADCPQYKDKEKESQ